MSPAGHPWLGHRDHPGCPSSPATRGSHHHHHQPAYPPSRLTVLLMDAASRKSHAPEWRGDPSFISVKRPSGNNKCPLNIKKARRWASPEDSGPIANQRLPGIELTLGLGPTRGSVSLNISRPPWYHLAMTVVVAGLKAGHTASQR